jgi:hypothetical protein
MTDRDDYERLAELADGIEGAGRFSFTGDYVLLPSMTRRDRDLVATALRRAASVKTGEVVAGEPLEAMLGRPYGQEKSDVRCADSPCCWPNCGCGRTEIL